MNIFTLNYLNLSHKKTTMKKGTFTSAGRIICLLLTFILFSVASQAQSQKPASNISGPLKGYIGGTNLTLTSEIASGIPNPAISYSFDRNSSGATIVSQGAFVYDRVTGTGKHMVVVNPGSAKGGFTIKLTATTPAGTSESSKSVTVLDARGSGDSSGNNAGF